jgi:hypothetical protein
MIRYLRTAAVAVAVVGLVACGGVTSAHAQTEDERFVQTLSELGITAGPETDLPAVGRSLCDSLTQQLASNPNPAPVVRGLISSLRNLNLSREQAVGFLQTAVPIYCPQHARFTNR